jgi:hypothetical protein
VSFLKNNLNDVWQLLIVCSDAPIIMAGVTIFAILSWWFTPADAWLSKKHISHFLEGDSSGGEDIAGDSKGTNAAR